MPLPLRNLLFLLMALWALQPLGGWAAQAGVIQSVDGRARVWERSGLERPAQPNVQIFEGDTVASAAGSSVQMRMSDGALIWLRPDSQLKVEQYVTAKGSERALLQLVKGGFRAVTGLIGKLRPDDYRAQTANAALGIRGTDYELVFVAPDQSAALRSPPGTYNRVHLGATWLSARSVRIVVNENEAAFVGLGPQDTPRLLPKIPDFLQQPTGSTPAGASPVGAAMPSRELLARLRFGVPPELSNISSASSREASSPSAEQQLRLSEGKAGTLLLSSGADRATRNAGAPAPARTAIELLATAEGSRLSVRIRLQQEGGARDAGSLALATTLSVQPGQWEEITGRGPFRESPTDTASSRDARNDTRRVFLRIDELNR
jgi:hypothetical protein